MRFARVAVSVLTTAALALPIGAVATADAAEAPADKAPRQFREITDKGQQSPNGRKYYMKVAVKDYQNGRIVLQRADCKKCKYKDVEKDRVNNKGKITFNLPGREGKAWWYRAYTPKTERFKTTYTNYVYKVRLVRG